VDRDSACGSLVGRGPYTAVVDRRIELNPVYSSIVVVRSFCSKMSGV
jgi:hypothetical protein